MFVSYIYIYVLFIARQHQVMFFLDQTQLDARSFLLFYSVTTALDAPSERLAHTQQKERLKRALRNRSTVLL